MLNPYQLFIFQTVALERSISRASEALFMSQPAVSQHIKALEKDLGVTLFKRGRKGVKLMPAGRILLEYTQELLLLNQEARAAVKKAAVDDQDSVVHIHVGATPGMGSYLMPDWIKFFYGHHEGVVLSIKIASTPELVHQVAGQQLAFAISGDFLEESLVEVTPLWREEAVIVVGEDHPWKEKPFIHAEMLNTQAFIMREESSLARAWEMQSLAAFGIIPKAVAEFTSPSAIKQAVMANMGIALLPCFSVEKEVRMKQLYPIHLYEGTFQRPLHLLWTPNASKSPSVQMLFRCLVEHADVLAFHPLESPRLQVKRAFRRSSSLQTLLTQTSHELLPENQTEFAILAG